MSDRPSPSGRVARAAALVCSLALASVVIVHAQFGCDAPASTEPAPAKRDPVPAAAKQDPPPPPTVEAAPEPKPEPPPETKEPVFMPASKSAGDFDSLPLAPPTNAPAKEPPAQQAQQAPQP